MHLEDHVRRRQHVRPLIFCRTAFSQAAYMHSFYNPTIPLPFPEAITALTLGSKYFLGSIREEALRRFTDALPTARNQFFAVITATSHDTYPSQRSHNVDPVLPIDMLKSDAIAAVNAAKALDLPYILPAAYFLCTQLSFKSLIGGVVDDFGRMQKLSTNDLELCLIARDEFHRGRSGAIGIILAMKDNLACTRDVQCLPAVREALGDVFQNGHEDRGLLFDEGLSLIDDLFICDTCYEQFIDVFRGRLDDIWRQLGPKFNVTPWPPQTQTRDQMATND